MSTLPHGSSLMMRGSSWTRPAVVASTRLTSARPLTLLCAAHSSTWSSARPVSPTSGLLGGSLGCRQSSQLAGNTRRSNNSTFRLQRRAFASDSLPDHFKIKLPALSPTMELGTIVSWQAKEGDQLSEGDLLCEIETDKATMGFETPEEGFLAKILIAEGEKDVPIGKLLCIIVEDEDDIAAFKDYKPTAEDDAPAKSAAGAGAPPPPPPPAAPMAPPPPATPAPTAAPAVPKPTAAPPKPKPAAPKPAAAPAKPGERVKATPFAKKLAAERGLDLSRIAGSGPGGRILASDVEAAQDVQPVLAAPPPLAAVSDADFIDIEVSDPRRALADRLTYSKQAVPHYYLTTECNLDKLNNVRKKLNELLIDRHGAEKAPKLNINDFVVKAAALACTRVKAVNSQWMETHVRQFNNVHINIGIATDDGMPTPTLSSAHAKGLTVIHREVATLADRARAGVLEAGELEGGTFTVSFLGGLGVKHFASIIQPPQACALAVGAPQTRILPDENAEHGLRMSSALVVTLSCDHRVVDGAVGAQWLKQFRGFIEKPHTMLL